MPQANKPAMTSGPGAMSRRTDGGSASKQAIRYAAGEPGAEDFVNLQSQAPMSKTPDVKSMPPSQVAQAAQQGQPQQAIPLGAPSQLPNEPVTHGADAGPGMGSDGLILPKPTDPRQNDVNSLVARYLPDLQAATNIPGVPDSYRRFVNYLSSQAQNPGQA
jgi:hypothetical protein